MRRNHLRQGIAACGLGGAVLTAGVLLNADPTITLYTIPTSFAAAQEITKGPDGNLWFTERLGNKIGRITPSGTIDEFVIPTAFSEPWGIAAGPDGNLWFTEELGHKIGRITPTGAITEFPLPPVNNNAQQPRGITAGPDGNLWFTVDDPTQQFGIGRINPTTGVITQFGVALGSAGGITTGPDNNLWFADGSGNRIGKITPTGTVTMYSVPTTNASPNNITAGPDGHLWFTESFGKKIGRITPSGAITEFPTSCDPNYIAVGPDGNLWFTEFCFMIGRITPAGIVTEWVTSGINLFPIGITAGPDLNLWATSTGSSNKIARIELPPGPPTIQKAFTPGTIPPGGAATLSFTITNLNSTTLTGVAFTDTLPVGMVVATPNDLTGSCGGGTITAVSGSASVALTSGDIPARSSCSFSVTINGPVTVGAVTNTTGSVTSSEGTGGTASAILTVASSSVPANCHGNLVADLAHQHGGLSAAAAFLGYPSSKALQNAIKLILCGS